jgi:hypothetical protein
LGQRVVGERFSPAATATATLAAVTATAAAATVATDAVLGHGREEVGVLFHNEIKLLALGFDFCAWRGRQVCDHDRSLLLGNILRAVASDSLRLLM